MLFPDPSQQIYGILSSLVDDRSTETFHNILLVRRNGGENFCSEGTRHLNRNMPDTTGSGMDQYFVVSANLSAVDESLPRCYRAQREGRGLTHREILRLVCDQVRVGGNEFGKRALQAADTANHSIDFITRPESADTCPNCFDRPSHIEAEHRGKWLFGVRCLACANLGIQRVHAAGGDSHQDLIRRRF